MQTILNPFIIKCRPASGTVPIIATARYMMDSRTTHTDARKIRNAG